MICKWCGETIKIGAKTCKRCKRELPALSDCGGFYDLVPKDTPVPTPAAEPKPAVQPPVRPVLPQPKQTNPVINVVLILSVVMAVISLILTISLSGKLADAREEADSLRDQLKSGEDASQSQPATPNINGLGEKDPESTDEPDELTIVLEDGAGEITLNKAHNECLNTGILHISVSLDGEDEPLLTFTLQRQPAAEDGEELFLQIAESDDVVIHSIECHNDKWDETEPDEEESSDSWPSQDAITEYTVPTAELGEGKCVCTLTGEDKDGEKLTITIGGIVIE